MPRVDQSTINWAVYEDNTEYAGMAQATLPNLTALTQSISGAGIAGNVDAVILGHFDAMSMTLNYRTMTEQAVRLSEPRRHNIDLRYAVQDEDPVAAAVQIRAIKHILVVIPKTHTPGTAFGMDAISAHRQSTQSTKTAIQQPLQAAGYWRDIDG